MQLKFLLKFTLPSRSYDSSKSTLGNY